MRNYYFHPSMAIMALVLIVSLTFCSKEDVPEPDSGVAPVLKLNETEVLAAFEGGRYSISYAWEGSADDISLKLECTADWVSEFDSGKTGKISFTVAENGEEVERETMVDISYPGAENSLSFKILQSSAELKKFSIRVSDIQQTKVSYEIERIHHGFDYIFRVLPKSFIEENGLQSDEALWKEESRQIRENAQSNGMAAGDYVGQISLKEDQSGQYGGLDMDTEYLIYAYGVKGEGEEFEKLTQIYRQEFSTSALERQNIRFDVECGPEDGIYSIHVTPIDYSDLYYIGVIEGKYTDSEELYDRAVQDWMEIRQEYLDMGYNCEVLLYDLAYRHEQYDYYTPDKADTDYTVYVLALENENAYPISDVSSASFHTEKIKMSDNVVSFTVENLRPESMEVYFNPSNEDLYVGLLVENSEISGMTESEIFEYILENKNVDRYLYSGRNGDYYDDLIPDTEYTMLAFGLQYGSVTTSLFRSELKTRSAEGGTAQVELEIGPHYDMDAAVELNPALDIYQGYAWSDAFLVISLKSITEGIPFNNCIMELFEAEENPTDERIREILMYRDDMDEEKEVAQVPYNKKLFLAAIVADEEGRYGKLFKSEVFVLTSEDSSDPHELLEWWDGDLDEEEEWF